MQQQQTDPPVDVVVGPHGYSRGNTQLPWGSYLRVPESAIRHEEDSGAAPRSIRRLTAEEIAERAGLEVVEDDAPTTAAAPPLPAGEEPAPVVATGDGSVPIRPTATAMGPDYPGRAAWEAAGYTSREEVEALTDEEMDATPGVGPATVQAVREFAAANPLQ